MTHEIDFAGAVAVDEHAGVPAQHLRPAELVRDVLGQAQRLELVRLRLLPLLACRGRYAAKCLH